MRLPAADFNAEVKCRRSYLRRRRDVIQRSLVVSAPAALLGSLSVVQAVDAIRGGVILSANPDWPRAVEVVREILYGTFVLVAAVVLWTTRDPRHRDARGRVIAVSLSASFLLVFVGLLPNGPVVWQASYRMIEIGLFLSVVGAGLALVTLASLKSNFSIVPEVRSLVVTGPYQWLRHPMYFAELLMIVGIVLSDPHITYLVGAMSVLVLQVYRILMEERLLSTNFPAAHKAFVAHTRYRLIPRVW